MGSKPVTAMYVGSQPIQAVYRGATKLWPSYRVIDNFQSAAVTQSIWTITGVTPTLATFNTAIEAGNGKGDGWTKQDVMVTPFDKVEHVIYRTTDSAQRNSLLIGSPSEYYYLEYSVNDWILGYYDGRVWSIKARGGSYGLTAGSRVALHRNSSTQVQALHNDVVLGTGTIPSTSVMGPGNLRTGWSLRAAQNFFVWWRSPAIDDILVHS